jgi:glycerol-3-phosphate dehydrogenase
VLVVGGGINGVGDRQAESARTGVVGG